MYQRDPRKPKLGGGPMSNPDMVRTAQPAQHANIASEPSAIDMLKQQAIGKVGGKAIDKGMEKAMPMAQDAMAGISNMFSAGNAATGAMQAGVDPGIANMMAGATGSSMAGGAGSAAAGAAGATGAGAMAGLGAAMPWLGAGLLGAKMFGLFSEGGLVGPLAGIKYKSMGGEVSDEFNVNFVAPLSAKE